jgi:hypothetical protein
MTCPEIMSVVSVRQVCVKYAALESQTHLVLRLRQPEDGGMVAVGCIRYSNTEPVVFPLTPSHTLTRSFHSWAVKGLSNVSRTVGSVAKRGLRVVGSTSSSCNLLGPLKDDDYCTTIGSSQGRRLLQRRLPDLPGVRARIDR